MVSFVKVRVALIAALCLAAPAVEAAKPGGPGGHIGGRAAGHVGGMKSTPAFRAPMAAKPGIAKPGIAKPSMVRMPGTSVRPSIRPMDGGPRVINRTPRHIGNHAGGFKPGVKPVVGVPHAPGWKPGSKPWTKPGHHAGNGHPGGDNGHGRHHRRHVRPWLYTAPIYVYESYDKSDANCAWLWRKYLATGHSKWKFRYYECID